MGDGGGRAAGNGGMGGGSSTGSRGGSRGSSGSRNNSASPGRSTPGSPSAADGNRGSTMGAGGGSAPSTGSSSGGGGSSTNPGRPGGEAGPSVDGSDGYSGYSGNSDTSSFGSSSGGSSGGSESIRGSRDARFSFNAPDAGSMTSFRSDRQAARSLDGVAGFGLNGTDQGGVASGTIASGESLDTTTPGYRAVVGDGELSENRQLNEALMQARDLNPPDVRTNADEAALAADKNRIDEATDDSPLRTFVPAPLEALADLGENYVAQERYGEDLASIRDQYSLQEGYFGTPGLRDATEAAISEGTGGLVGNRDRMGRVAIGIAENRNNDRNIGGKGNTDRGIIEQYLPPEETAETPQAPNPSNSRYGGRLTNYGSYRRRFRRALAPRV